MAAPNNKGSPKPVQGTGTLYGKCWRPQNPEKDKIGPVLHVKNPQGYETGLKGRVQDGEQAGARVQVKQGLMGLGPGAGKETVVF